MKDNRDPEFLGSAIIMLKSVTGMPITEAADKVMNEGHTHVFSLNPILLNGGKDATH